MSKVRSDPFTPRGAETRVTYDARGLVSTVREPSAQTTTNFYDAKGRLTNVTDAVGTRLFSHDANDNLTAITNVGQASRLSQTFDAYDRMTSHTNSDGYVIQWRVGGCVVFDSRCCRKFGVFQGSGVKLRKVNKDQQKRV